MAEEAQKDLPGRPVQHTCRQMPHSSDARGSKAPGKLHRCPHIQQPTTHNTRTPTQACDCKLMLCPLHSLHTARGHCLCPGGFSFGRTPCQQARPNANLAQQGRAPPTGRRRPWPHTPQGRQEGQRAQRDRQERGNSRHWKLSEDSICSSLVGHLSQRFKKILVFV